MRKLNGKIALAAGASSGVGAATALGLAAEGATVAIAARRRQRLDGMATRIRDAGGEALTAMVRRVLESHGRLDMLFNVAGVGVAARYQARGERHGGIAVPRNRQGRHPGHRDRTGRGEDRVHRQHARRCALEHRLGDMEQLQSENIAAAMLYAVSQPPRVNVNILTFYPMQQA